MLDVHKTIKYNLSQIYNNKKILNFDCTFLNTENPPQSRIKSKSIYLQS